MIGRAGGLVLALALGLAPLAALAAEESEVPYKSMESGLSVHEMAKRMDRASFAGAVASYPTTAGGTHRVRIGRYFMWSIVKLFAAPRSVERISLQRFSETCTLYKSGFSQAVMCRLSMAVRVDHRGRARDISFALRKQVGAHFEPGGDYTGVVHGEVTLAVDDAVAHIGRELAAMGVR